MIKFLKENWFKLIITLLSILLVSAVINYINIYTNYIIQKHNFSIFKWSISEDKAKIFNTAIERFGL